MKVRIKKSKDKEFKSVFYLSENSPTDVEEHIIEIKIGKTFEIKKKE